MSKPSWITLSKESGSGDNIVQVTASQHSGRVARSGNITISGNGVSSKTITITQDAQRIFASFDNAEITVDKNGNRNLLIYGKSNSRYLNFYLTGADTQYTPLGFCQMTFYADGEEKGGTYGGMTAESVEFFPFYGIGEDTHNVSGSESLGTLGETELYEFYAKLEIPANPTSIEQRIHMHVTGSEATSYGHVVIRLAGSDAYLEVYQDSTHVTPMTSLNFAANGESKYAFVASNTAWNIE